MRISRFLVQVSSVALLPTGAWAQAAPSSDVRQVQADCPPGASVTTDCRRSDDDIAPSPQQNADGSTVAETGGDVVVTGTRIRSRNYETPYSTLVTDKQYVDERNLTNVADALNNLPGIRGSITPNGAQGSFGQGVNFLNSFGLGSNRTLTLVNGKRFVTSNPNTLFNQGSAGTQVDSNVVQSILLDRAEQVSIAGATIYGSDAIGGTINYILRDRFQGLIVQGLAGVTEQGDGFRYNAAFLAGHDYLDGRLNVTVAYTRDVQNGILFDDRDFLRQGVSSVTNPTSAQAIGLGRTAASGITPANDGRLNTNFGYNNSTTDGFPGSVLVRDRTLYQVTTGGIISAATGGTRASSAVYNYQFDGGGNLVPFNRGTVFAAPYASGGDGYRLYPFSQVTSDLQRHTANVFVHYDQSDALKFYFEGTYFHSVGDQLVTQPTYNASLFGGLSAGLTFAATNPFLSTQARQQLAALSITRFSLSRASVDLANTSGGTDTDIGRAVLGVKGDFKIGSRSFNYEAYANYGRTHLLDRRQDLNSQNFINAVNVTTNAAGQIVCDPNPAVSAAPGGRPVADSACVPLNLFGTGAPSAAARNYVIQDASTNSLLQQKDFVAYIAGSPFALFGNDYSFSVGYEHREEDGRFTPSTFQQLGLGRSVAIAPTTGSYNVDEVYGETQLPLISPDNNIPLVHFLTVKGGFRYVDNTVNGGFLAWSGGGEYSPVRDLMLRGNFTRSFRGPALTELFLPRSNSFVTVDDLCAPGARNAGPAPATRAANCAAFLAAYPNATPLDAAAATVPGVNGGNLTLQNEVSNSYSFGGVLQPRWIPRLTIQVDYINIKIRNPIANLTVSQIVSACFDNPDFNTADPANGNAFCSQIQRYATGQGGTAANGGDRGGQVVVNPTAPGVSSGFVNGNRIDYSGIQGAIDYSIPLEAVGIPGRFETSEIISYVNRRLSDITGIAPQRTDGIFGDPKFQFRSDNRFVMPGIGGISASVNFIGKQIATRTALSADLREINRLPSYATVDASFWVDVLKKYRMTFSVTNVGNKRFFNYYGFALPTQYIDQFGRRFAVSARATF